MIGTEYLFIFYLIFIILIYHFFKAFVSDMDNDVDVDEEGCAIGENVINEEFLFLVL